MKQALYVVIATVLTGILLFLLSRCPVKHTETITGRPEDKLAGQAASIVRAQNAVGTSGNYREQTAKPSNVFRTSRLSIGSGAVTVLEIDHGLPEQLVDTPEMRRGVEHGLLGAITLRVVDSSGLPVPSATVRGAFFNQRQPKDKRRFEIETDADGIVSLENENMGFVNFTIEKQAHYSSVIRYWFFKNGYDCAKDGRWLPWNPTVEIVLKEKRNPVSMQRKDRLWLTFPKHQTVGFDVETGDLVEPFGTGKVADLSFWFDSWQYTEPYCYSNCFVVTAESGATIAAMRKDSFSDFKFAYAPPDSGWVSDLTLGMVRTKDKILSNVALGKEEYWVVAVRRGERKRFAVISDFEFGGSDRGTNYCGVLLSYYLNPNAGDTNLEIKGPYP
jgi:hypothetical protein